MVAQVGAHVERLIVFHSKYGSTEDYALKLAQELSCKSMALEDLESSDLVGLDQIIFGAPLRNGSIDRIKDFFKIADRSETLAKIAIWVNCVSTYREEYFTTLRERDINDRDQEIPLFYTRGNWNLEEMSFIDRQLAKAQLRSVEKRDPENMSLTEATLSDVGEEPEDYTDYEYLKPIMSWAREGEEPGIGRGETDDRISQIVMKKTNS